MTTPMALNSRLPSGTCRVARLALAVFSTASSPLPRLAPSTSPSATSMPTALMDRVAVSSTTARLEYDSTASVAPTRISSMRSLVSDSSISCTAGLAVSTWVAWLTSCRASSISPRPMSTRPTSPTGVPWRRMKSVTPMKMHSGESQDRSKENTTAMTAVPMSAPSITASAASTAMRTRPTKEAAMSAVAVLDCTGAVTPRP